MFNERGFMAKGLISLIKCLMPDLSGELSLHQIARSLETAQRIKKIG